MGERSVKPFGLKNIFCGLAAAGLLFLLAYGAWIEPVAIEVNHIYIRNAPFCHVLGGKTAVHLSDLHMDRMGPREKRVLALIETIKPDLIFLTGDYVTWSGDYEPALAFLAELKAEMGVWGVLGDYDYSNSRKSCLFCHQPAGKKADRHHRVMFLRNASHRIDSDRGAFQVLGTHVSDNLSGLDQNLPAIVLSHSPLAFDGLAPDAGALMLAGDTHGGQVPVPSWLWQMIGYRKNARYNQGMFRNGNNTMYVSRGIGTSHLPIRILRPPELVVLHF